MKKNILLLTLIATGLIFFGNQAHAKLSDPTGTYGGGPSVTCVKMSGSTCIVGQGSATLNWNWTPPSSGSVTIKQFKVLFQESGSPTWQVRYPAAGSAGQTSYTYNLTGLVENTNYEWIIKAEANDPSQDSNLVPGQPFTTDVSNVGGGGGTGGGGGGGGGSFINIQLTNPLNANSLQEAIDDLINILFVLAFGIAPVLLIWAGFLILFKSDDAKERNKARNIILWVLIGLAVIVLAKTLPAVISGALGA